MPSKSTFVYGGLAAVALGITGMVVAPVFSANSVPSASSESKVQGPSAASIQWKRLDDAVALAGKSGKPVLVSVYADWCGYCKLMERTTFVDAGVVKLLESGFHSARLNGESSTPLKLGKISLTESEWAMGNGVQGFPATFLLDAKGKPFAGLPGYIEAPQMSQFLKDAQAYLKAGGPAKQGDFYDWAEKRK